MFRNRDSEATTVFGSRYPQPLTTITTYVLGPPDKVPVQGFA
jgi:hypothetical protein